MYPEDSEIEEPPFLDIINSKKSIVTVFNIVKLSLKKKIEKYLFNMLKVKIFKSLILLDGQFISWHDSRIRLCFYVNVSVKIFSMLKFRIKIKNILWSQDECRKTLLCMSSSVKDLLSPSYVAKIFTMMAKTHSNLNVDQQILIVIYLIWKQTILN